MKFIIDFARAGAIDAVLLGVLIHGFLGVDILANVGLFLCWVIAVSMLLGVGFWGSVKKDLMRSERSVRLYLSRTWVVWDIAVNAAIVLVLAATGHFVTAAVLGAGKWMFKLALHDLAKERAAQAELGGVHG